MIKPYLEATARPIDLRRYEHLFEGASAEPVLQELEAFQNSDGGFGKALEPDVRLPGSSVLATTIAFQFLAGLDGADDSSLVDGAVRFLLDSFDQSGEGWRLLPAASDEHPHAPWWNDAATLSWAGWGNPSAEVLGYLLANAELVGNDAFLAELSDRAVQHLHDIAEPEQHEVTCYLRLYANAGLELKGRLHDRLAQHVDQSTERDPSAWSGYVATPLTFVRAPDAPFADVYDPALLQRNAESLSGQLVDGTHWEPPWEWGQYEDVWPSAKQDLCGKLTVDNLQILRAFDVSVD